MTDEEKNKFEDHIPIEKYILIRDYATSEQKRFLLNFQFCFKMCNRFVIEAYLTLFLSNTTNIPV